MIAKDIADAVFAAAFVRSFEINADAKEAYSQASFIARQYQKEHERREDEHYDRLDAKHRAEKKEQP